MCFIALAVLFQGSEFIHMCYIHLFIYMCYICIYTHVAYTCVKFLCFKELAVLFQGLRLYTCFIDVVYTCVLCMCYIMCYIHVCIN